MKKCKCGKEAVWTIASRGCSPFYFPDGIVIDIYPSTLTTIYLCQECYEKREKRMKQ